MQVATLLGLARSLAIYHAVPGRVGRLRRLYAPFVPAGGLCFDVGAHAGNRVRCFRALGARVVAVEPQREFARLLRWMFGRDPSVVVVEAALGAARGLATLHVSARTPTVSTLSPAWLERVRAEPSFRDVRWEPGPSVVVRTLDDLIAHYGLPDFVKIDVEGMEEQVLAGLSQPVAALSFEYLGITPDLAAACVDRLASLGDYRFNWSPGESMRLAGADWLDAARMRERLPAICARGGSGDIYACLSPQRASTLAPDTLAPGRERPGAGRRATGAWPRTR
ncbi:MAG: FkbM family methyltransferase [Burkholderiaceae bacterium]|nr:FkbM family methyltransferase [Burkholderiaceae bacterium]